MARPVLTTLPWRRAWFALRRRPALAMAAAVVGGVVGLVAAAPVLFVSSVGAAAVQVQWERSCPASVAPTLHPGSRVPPMTDASPSADPALDRLVTATARSAAFTAPEHVRANYGPTPVTFGAAEASIGFLSRPEALDHVELIGPSADGDLWIPDTLAAALGAGAGDTIVVRPPGAGDDGIPVTVAGVFADLAARRLDGYWCAADRAIVPQNLFGEIFPPPMAVIAPGSDATALLDGSLVFSRHIAPFASPPRTIADARRLVDATTALRVRIERAGAGDRVVAGIDRLERRASLVREAVRDTTLPVALLAVGCTLAVCAVLGTMWVRVRRATCTALVTIGVSPAAIGTKAAWECLLPMFAGAAGGAATARWSMSAWAPTTSLEPGTWAWVAAAVSVATATGLVLVAVTAGRSSRTLLVVAAPPRRRRAIVRAVPVELLLVVAIVWASRDLRTEALVPLEGRRVVDTGGSVLLLPLAVLALGASVTARSWFAITARRRSSTLPSRLSARLAVRRLQFGSRAGSALVGAGTLAVGVSVFGLAMNESLARTAEAKAAVLVGGRSSLLIAGELPPGTPDATEVWLREEMEYAGMPVDVVALDPATFATVAFWDDAFADQPLASLVAAIDRPPDVRPVPVVLVGDAPPSGALRNPGNASAPIDVAVVASARAFPGASRDRPTLITTIAAMDDGPIGFRHFVWADGPSEEWRARLQESGARPVLGLDRQQAVDGSVLLFASWSFDFVRALGVFVGLLAVAALVLHLAARQRQHALELDFLRRMGFGPRRHWWSLVVETAALVAVVVVLGVSLALVCAHIVSPYVDPLPSLLPDPLSVVPWRPVAAVLAIAATVVVVATAIAQAAGARVDVAEVLRDGT